MERTNILKQLLLDKYCTVSEISRQSGLPYSTIKSIFERGIGNASVTNVLELLKLVNVTIDELEKMANGSIIIHTKTEDLEELDDIDFAFAGEAKKLSKEDKEDLLKIMKRINNRK